MQAIVEVENAGGKVDVIVSDGAATNRSVWRRLHLSGKLGGEVKNKFTNPTDDKRWVYALSDAPHLIKCIRNRLEKKKTLRVMGILIYAYI